MATAAPPFPRALRWYTAGVATASVAFLAILLSWRGGPELAPFALFSVLALFSRHRDVRLPGGVKVSAATMIFMAAVVYFATQRNPSGAVAVAMIFGVYVGHMSRQSWAWIPFNAGSHGLAVAGAVLVYAPLDSRLPSTFPCALLPLVAATAAYLVLEQSILLGSFWVEDHAIPRELIAGLPRYVLELLPFAGIGFVLGRMYLSLGPAVVVLMVVPIVIARELFASYLEVTQSHEHAISMLIRMLEAKDHYTAGHAERVANYAHYIGEELGLMPGRMERLRFAALMHDIGKLVVPNHLLNKPGRLTAEEFAQVRIHEKVGVQMLSHIDFLRPIAASTHGESMIFDPDDPAHPIEPYIIMVADAYDAMTSTRAYRKALPQEVAFAELRDKSGTQFHPACAQALINAIEKRDEHHGAGFEAQPEFDAAPDGALGSAGLGDLEATSN